MTFWSDFWPNLASTLVGVGVGVPFGLWLNRKAVEHGDTARRKAERTEVAHTLQVLCDALKDNLTRLQTFSAVLARRETLFDTGLDASAWAALQAGLTSELKKPALRQQLARFFARLGGVISMNERYINSTVGVDAAMGKSQEVRDKLGTAIPAAVADLIRDGTELVTQLDAAARELAA